MDNLIATNEYIGHAGVKYIFEYHESDSFDHLPKNKLKQCYAVAFYKEEMVIVHNKGKDTWGLVGGSIEEGEHPDETLIREVREESNMEVISFKPIGYQKVIDTRGVQEPFYQLRYFALVEKNGEFETDPAGHIDKILCIEVTEYREYFDWGNIGEKIVERATKLKKESK